MRKEIFTVGQLIRSGITNGAVTVKELNESNHVTECECATGSIPSGVANVYAIGCLLTNTTTGHLYSNTSLSSCSFHVIGA